MLHAFLCGLRPKEGIGFLLVPRAPADHLEFANKSVFGLRAEERPDVAVRRFGFILNHTLLLKIQQEVFQVSGVFPALVDRIKVASAERGTVRSDPGVSGGIHAQLHGPVLQFSDRFGPVGDQTRGQGTDLLGQSPLGLNELEFIDLLLQFLELFAFNDRPAGVELRNAVRDIRIGRFLRGLLHGEGV